MNACASAWGVTKDKVSVCALAGRGEMIEPFFFVHVPKTAGGSVSAILRTMFPEEDICPHPAVGAWEASQLRGYRLYSGHFSIDFVDQVAGAESVRLIMLRHPVARVISLFDYLRSYRWEHQSAFWTDQEKARRLVNSGSLGEFLNMSFAANAVYNQVAQVLLGERSTLLLNDESRATDEALRALERFAWVGITERFTDSIDVLTKTLGLPTVPSLPWAHCTYQPSASEAHMFEPVCKTIPTEKERRRILDGNRVDIAIYRRGCEILRERVSRMYRQSALQRLNLCLA